MAMPTTIRSLGKNMSCLRVLRPVSARGSRADFECIALHFAHVDQCARIQRRPWLAVEACLPAGAAIMHARETCGAIDPPLEARRLSGIDRAHLLRCVAPAVSVDHIHTDCSDYRGNDYLHSKLQSEPGRERRAESCDTEHQQI